MVILHSSGKNTNIIISWLRHDFAIISQLFYENHIVLNQHKSQFPTLDFNEPSPDFSFNNTLIENVIEKCILALVIDNKLNFKSQLTLFWRRSLSYRNQSTDLLCKSMDWFLCYRGLRHERVEKYLIQKYQPKTKALLIHFQPMFHFYTPENIRKHPVFWCFQGV